MMSMHYCALQVRCLNDFVFIFFIFSFILHSARMGTVILAIEATKQMFASTNKYHGINWIIVKRQSCIFLIYVLAAMKIVNT